MIRLRLRLARRDDGVAMLFVVAIGMIVTALVVAMFATILQTQKTTRQHRNVTSAQAAAEAGVDDAVYELGQSTSGISNWSQHIPGGSDPWTKASPYTQTFGSNTTYQAWLTGPIVGTSNYILWSTGTFGDNTRTIRAVVTQGSPPAFDFSMFASKGIDIHHHGSSWLSPQVWTTGVHSNGYINIDYSAEFTVNNLEAVTTLLLSKGGGSTPGGSITSDGYNWYDPLNGKCYPGGLANPGGVVSGSPPNCSSTLKYSGNAVISGTVKAGSVTINSHGQVLPVSSAITLDTSQVIKTQSGEVYAGSANIGGNSYTTTTAGNACSVCNKGSSTTAGQISGPLHVTPGYAPETIAFPSINYATTYRVAAQNEQNASGVQHVFTGSGTWLGYITNPANGFYRTIDPNTHQLTAWDPNADPKVAPDVIYLNGTWDITSGSVVLSYGTIANLVHAATGTNGPAPMIVIQGSLIAEGGGMTLKTPLVMVGTGNRTDFLTAGTATTPVTVDTTKLLDPNATGPAVLAAGGSIDGSDYDTDSSWTSVSQYEPAKASPMYVRGLVYSASWNATTQSSTPQNQHWHNYDPKNLIKIYGAQVGGTLHDCNNFSFSYDPLVQRAFGFGSGTVKVIDYQELGT